METKKIAVIFPGRNYGTDCPLLYYARLVLESRGYETIAVNYGMAGKSAGSREASSRKFSMPYCRSFRRLA